MNDNVKTPEQLAQEAAALAERKQAEKAAQAEQKAAQKAANAERKAAEAAERKAQKEAEAEAKKAEREAGKAAAEAEKQAKREAAALAKEQGKADREAAKLASRMPEQNGVRMPKAETTTGQVWAKANELSANNGSPVSIGELKEHCSHINDNTIKTQYAQWRKFHGVVGRIVVEKVAATEV